MCFGTAGRTSSSSLASGRVADPCSSPRGAPRPQRRAAHPDGHRREADPEEDHPDEDRAHIQATERGVRFAEQRDSEEVVQERAQDEARASDGHVEPAYVVYDASPPGPLNVW